MKALKTPFFVGMDVLVFCVERVMNFKKLLACWLCGCAAVVLAQTTSGVLESGGARIEVLGHSVDASSKLSQVSR